MSPAFYKSNLNRTELYSLKEFNYADSGIRETSDIQDRYNKGAFGAIPDPNLIIRKGFKYGKSRNL